MSFDLAEDEKQESVCQVAEYTETAAALARLTDKFGKAVFDVSTKKGLEEAKQARAELRGYRTNLESMRKSIKAPALERCRLIDAEAKDITGKLEALEKPIAAQIEAEETRKEAEKQAKLNAEIARVLVLRERITGITAIADSVAPTSDACQNALATVKRIEINETFEELQGDAQQAKDAATFRLQNLFAQYTASEDEAKRLMAERAELEKLREADRLRREQEDRAAAEEREKLRAEELQRQKQERARVDAEIQEQRSQQAEEARKVREAQAAEQHRLDEESAALKKQQREAEEAERIRLSEVAAEKLRRKQENSEIEGRMHQAAPLLLAAGILLLKQYDESPSEFTMGGKLTNEPFMKMRKAIAIAPLCYFAEDGTLMNADGTRSIFDDVDE